jgi:hypothetical protein
MKLIVAIAALALLVGAAPARAVEQCRFIQAKPEREACYERQSAELAAKRKRAAENDGKVTDQVRQMRQEDEAVYQSMRGICRGC